MSTSKPQPTWDVVSHLCVRGIPIGAVTTIALLLPYIHVLPFFG
jgi:hypothetical protein